MASTEEFTEHFDIMRELCFGLEVLPPNTILPITECYSYGSRSVQLCLKQDETAKSEYWFAVNQRMPANGREYLLLEYPPDRFEGADRIPLLLVEYLGKRKIRSLTEEEYTSLRQQALEVANKSARLNVAVLEPVLGKIPDWDEIKHRM